MKKKLQKRGDGLDLVVVTRKKMKMKKLQSNNNQMQMANNALLGGDNH